MNFRKVLILPILGVTIFFIWNCTTQEKNVVAEIEDDYTITTSQLNGYYNGNFFERRFPDEKYRGYGKALDEMISNRLTLIVFFHSGLHRDSVLMQPVQRIVSDEILDQYYRTQFLGEYVNEPSIESFYQKMGKEITYKQIVLDKPENASGEAISQVKEQANQLKTEIIQGADFGELAARHSEHFASAQKNGDMPPITWEESLSNPLHQFLFEMNTGNVRIFERRNAFHIVRVEDTKRIETPPLADVRDRIKNRLKNMYTDRALSDFDRAKEDLLDPDTFEWNEKAVHQLVRWSRQEGFSGNDYLDSLKAVIAGGRNFTILTYGKGQVDLREYVRLLEDVLMIGSTRNLAAADFKRFIPEAIRTDLMLKKAKELDLHKKVLSVNTPSEVLQGRFIRLYNQKKIYDRVPDPTEDNLRRFYDHHKDSLFYQLAKRNIYTVIFDSRDAANEMWRKVEQGNEYEKVARRWEVKTYIRDRDGTIRSHLSKEPPRLGEAAFGLEENEVAGPVAITPADNDTQYAVIKCVNSLEEKQLLYSDVQNSIQENFRDFYLDSLRQAVRKNLRNKYRVEIKREILEQLATNGLNGG
ncbi:MAG: peptidylprolyl isomerase [Candidatus Marinimicrobia bacterium]|nr:peptidylprolyl isomerase [Candidatus Neomarinimicrobiota bacterium]MCF7827624.1 peptidylprolyl isomerase [Candidatus Neomarinimicrobiota bacterium]MCF7881321.1 peptidylprolyl isomerase [Candidatus Neomarinimicrobiota bacterium]